MTAKIDKHLKRDTQDCYSRNNPSPEYLRLSALYKEMHSPEKKDVKGTNVYPGRSLWPHIGFIKSLCDQYNVETILDYGAGKGQQYTDLWVKPMKRRIYFSIEKYWSARVTCYDAGNPEFNVWPEGQFDAVISTDVLEHCPREDLSWIIGEMFEKAENFVFANIACYPAKALLPNGENAHATIEKPEWWRELIISVAEKYPDVDYYFLASEKKNDKAILISNAPAPENVIKVGVLPSNILMAFSILCSQKLKSLFRKI